MEVWHIWMLSAILFFIIEIFTPSFFSACIGIGCVASGVLAIFCPESSAWQWAIFAVATAAAFFLVRPFMLKYAYKKSDKVKTNTDRIVGKVGRVTETIDPTTGTGRVNVGGDDWRAKTEEEGVIEKGEQVEVLKVESVTITVKKV
jgi:membrane protein implicated in regulation of membrane protease activity